MDAINEARVTDFVAGLIGWLAPMPTAWLVGNSTVVHLGWPVMVAVVAALIIEGLGLAAVNTALTLREYNQSKRKSDAPAPFLIALLLVIGYVCVAVALTVTLDVAPGMAVVAPAIFPMLSLTGMTILALRADHKRRIESVKMDKAERKASRQSGRKAVRDDLTPVRYKPQKFGADMDALNASRRKRQMSRVDRLLDAYLDNPNLTPTEASRMVGVSRQTVYNYLERLEEDGKIRKNGHGVEVLGR